MTFPPAVPEIPVANIDTAAAYYVDRRSQGADVEREPGQRLAKRIDWHRNLAKEYKTELRQPEAERDDSLMPEHMIEHEMRDHLIPNEIYG